MNTERKPSTDRELWQSLATDGPAAAGAVTELEFAAWLEGRLPEQEAARIEAAVAADPELRRAALEIADVLGKGLPAAPPRIAVRAQALIGFEVERHPATGSGWFGRLFSLAPAFGVPRAAMATAMLLVAVSGFVIGGGLGESFAAQRYGRASATQTSVASNELTAFFVADGI